MKTLIVGANRGIGLELCKQSSKRGDQLFTTCRKADESLQSLGCTVIENIDVSNCDDVARLKESLHGVNLDLIIHNAGILSKETLDDLDFERIQRQIMINTLGPLRVIHALLDNLSAGSKIGILSSRMGSLEDNGSGGMYGYRISKAGVNAAGVSLARDLESRKIAVALLHPGLVATGMTDHRGIDPSDAAAGIVKIMDRLTMEKSGKFWHAEGYILPW